MSPERIRLEGAARDVKLFEHTGASQEEALVQHAFERGRAAGRASAVTDAAQLLDQAVEQLERAREGAIGQLSRTAVELAVQIARHLLRREVRAENYEVEEIVRETLAEASAGRGPCTVHLHPKDLERLEGARFRTGTRLEADEDVSLGDVQVESSLGLLVREAFGALESIEKRLLEELS